MAERVILNGWSMDVRHRPAVGGGELDGQPELWTLLFEEISPPTGDTIEIVFNTETRDQLVSKLTGGIVLAGGKLPNLGRTPPSL